MTLLLSAVAVPINTVFGVTSAILIARNEFPGKLVVMSMLDLPFSISPVVTGQPCLLPFLFPRPFLFPVPFLPLAVFPPCWLPRDCLCFPLLPFFPLLPLTAVPSSGLSILGCRASGNTAHIWTSSVLSARRASFAKVSRGPQSLVK